MTRTHNDSWDLATSVGATATMVAVGRARATRDALVDDRFAEPLLRAVGVDVFTRWTQGEPDPADVDELRRRGCRPVHTPLNQLLAENALPLQRTEPGASFAENYCTGILHTAR